MNRRRNGSCYTDTYTLQISWSQPTDLKWKEDVQVLFSRRTTCIMNDISPFSSRHRIFYQIMTLKQSLFVLVRHRLKPFPFLFCVYVCVSLSKAIKRSIDIFYQPTESFVQINADNLNKEIERIMKNKWQDRRNIDLLVLKKEMICRMISIDHLTVVGKQRIVSYWFIF